MVISKQKQAIYVLKPCTSRDFAQKYTYESKKGLPHRTEALKEAFVSIEVSDHLGSLGASELLEVLF